MKRLRNHLLRACLPIVFTLAAGAPASATRVCVSSVQYPPFHYSIGAETVGVSIDILRNAIAAVPRAPFEIRALPWKRCLKLAELGMIDIVADVPTAQIDPAPFLISQAYVELGSAYYVSRRRWPHGIAIRNLQQLDGYRICGLSGNRYDSYGLRERQVDSGANNYLSLIGKLHAGHCDLFIEKRQVVAGLVLRDPRLAAAFSAPAVIDADLPEDSPVGLHFAVSRRAAQAPELLEKVDRAIARLHASGTIDAWTKAHLDGKYRRR